jgi:hypothetical protein
MAKKSIQQILGSEFSPQFIQAMQDRMVVSYHKYGPVSQGFPHKVNALESAQQRLKEYHKTGNTEFLVDAANFLMIEFMLPLHPDAHFTPTDSNSSPGRVNQDFEVTKASNNQISDSSYQELLKHRRNSK